MQKNSKQRILAIALTTRGFGYAVLEGPDSLVAYGHTRVQGDKNASCLVRVEKMIRRYRPDVLALHDVRAKEANRRPRIKKLHGLIVESARKRKLKIDCVSAVDVRRVHLGSAGGTKHQLAQSMATRFPDELGSHLPHKRKWYNSEDVRMDMFDAVALAVAFAGK